MLLEVQSQSHNQQLCDLFCNLLTVFSKFQNQGYGVTFYDGLVYWAYIWGDELKLQGF